MAAAHSHSEAIEIFHSFAARHDGKVKKGSTQFQRLREYYEMKTKAYAKAISKTQNEYWDKQAAMDETALGKKTAHKIDSAKRTEQNFEEELNLNYKDALWQLGYDTSTPPRLPATAVYSVQVVTTGWCNIDRAVYASTLNRTTLDFTDPQKGTKAVIKYLPFSVQVAGFNEYDQLYVYLLPNGLNSFMRLSGSNGTYSEKLDELMSYQLLCIGWKGEQTFFYFPGTIQPRDYSPVTLTAIGQKELEQQLNKAGSKTQAAELVKENAFFNFERTDQKRQKHNRNLELLRNKLMLFLFPCRPFRESSAPPDGESVQQAWIPVAK